MMKAYFANLDMEEDEEGDLLTFVFIRPPKLSIKSVAKSHAYSAAMSHGQSSTQLAAKSRAQSSSQPATKEKGKSAIQQGA